MECHLCWPYDGSDIRDELPPNSRTEHGIDHFDPRRFMVVPLLPAAMKSVALLARLLLFAIATPSLLRAEVPQLVVEHGDGMTASIPLESLAIRIRLDGAIAETVYDLAFRNNHPQERQGEFRMQLPPGATVSSYAIGVGDDLVEGVAVAKSKARPDYEGIKACLGSRELAQPAPCELLRTRISAIPSNGLRRIRIGTLETLALTEDRYRYRLGLGRKSLLPAEFACTLEVRDEEVSDITATSNLKMSVPENSVREISWINDLRIVTKAVEQPRLAIETDAAGEAWFTLQGRGPALPSELRPMPAKVAVVIDASASRKGTARGKEWAVLARVLREFAASEVQVYLLRTELESFTRINSGERTLTDLAAHWSAVSFDGAADFSRLEELNENLVFLFTDGELTGELFAPPAQLATPLVVFGSSHEPMHRDLVQAAHASGGVALQLDQGTEDELVEAAVAKPGRSPVRLLHPKEGVSTELVTLRDGRYLLHGRLGGRQPESFRFRVGEAELDLRAISKPRQGRPLGRSAWAIARLNRLLEEGAGDRAVCELAKEEALFTEMTSIIVPEQWDHHAPWEIPMPARELVSVHREARSQKVEPPAAPRSTAAALRLVRPAPRSRFAQLSAEEVVAKLTATGDARLRTTYEYLRRSGQMDETATLVEVARHFQARGDEAMTIRILSNLAERASNIDAGLRGMAYWLLDFEASETGIDLLRRLADAAPEDPVRQYDCASAMEYAGNPEGAVDYYRRTIRACEKLGRKDLAALARTGLGDQASPAEEEAYPKPIESSLRVLVFASSGCHQLSVNEPTSSLESEYGRDGTSASGGRVSPMGSVLEYEDRCAKPGRYSITCRFPHPTVPAEPVTVRSVFIERRDEGSPQVRIRTCFMTNGAVEFPAVEFTQPETGPVASRQR